MFKKAKRVNFRRRNESDDDEKEDGREPQIAPPPVPQQPCGPAGDEGSIRDPDAHNSEAVPGGTVTVHHGNGLQPSVGKAVKEKKKNNKDARDAPRASLLSFHDDEEDTEVFRVKKPNHSKKIVKQLKKEYKEDLEKNSTIRQETTASTDETVAPTLVTLKEEPKAGGSRASSEQGEEEMEVDSNEEPDEDGEPRGGAGAAFSNTLSSLSTLRPGEIPDAAFIHAARKRRQLARELGADGPAPEPEAGKKRLVREDEHDGSDDDEDEKRIVFSGVKLKTQRQKIAEEIGIEGSDDEALDTAGNDEEVSRWEQEQIRKGISIPQVQTSPPEDANMYYQSGYDVQPYGTSYSLTYSYSSVAGDDSKAKADTSVTFSAPSSDLTPITTDLVKKRLKDR